MLSDPPIRRFFKDQTNEENELRQLRETVLKLKENYKSANETVDKYEKYVDTDKNKEIKYNLPTSPIYSRGSKAVLSALRALQFRIGTLTRENEILTSKCSQTQSRSQAELTETRLKYQEAKHKIRELARAHEEKTLRASADENSISNLNRKIKEYKQEKEVQMIELQSLQEQFLDYKKISERRLQNQSLPRY